MTRLAAALAFLLPVSARGQSADLILRGGKVFLGRGGTVTAVAVTGNRVTATGSDKQIAAVKGPRTRVVELKGRLVIPGVHDAHARLLAGGLKLYRLDVAEAKSAADVRRLVAEYSAALPKDAWVVGAGWTDAVLSTGAALTPLEVLASTRPAALQSADGRALWVNAAARRRLRADTANGLLRGEAAEAALKRLPPPDRAQKLAALRLALEALREHGVTAVDELPDAGEPAAEEFFSLWRELAQRGEATARLVLFGRLEDPLGYLKLRAAALDLPRTRVLLPGVSGAIDGSLTDRTAWLSTPYFDAPEARGGSPKLSGLDLTTKVKAALAQGLQVSLRASGDKALHAALEVCAKWAPRAREQGAVLPRFACRAEAEVVSPDDLPHLKKTGVALAVQPASLVFDDIASNYYPDRLGDEVKRALPLRSLEDAGAFLVFGSGWPDRPLGPQASLYGAVSRKSRDGKPAQGLVPDEKLSAEGALPRLADDPWELAGLGDELGDIRPGRVADLVVLSRDVLAPGASPLDAEVDATVFDGRVVFEHKP